jgi:hypothetical protein
MSYDCKLEEHQIMIAKAHRIHDDAFFAMIRNYSAQHVFGTVPYNDIVRTKIESAECWSQKIQINIDSSEIFNVVAGSVPGGEPLAPPNYFSVALFKGILQLFPDIQEFVFFEGRRTPSNNAAVVKVFTVKYNKGISSAYFNFSDQE